MMAFDMGGPVNKAAYAFAVGVLPLIGKPLLFVVALVVGTLISTVAVFLLKQLKVGAPRGVEPAVSATAVSA